MLDKLDSCIAHRADITGQKEQRLTYIRTQLETQLADSVRLALYNQMYEEYYTYRYDSALVYVQRSDSLATLCRNRYYGHLAAIHRAMLYATTGFYHEAKDLLNSLDTSSMDNRQLYELNYTQYWLYILWHAYCGDSEFSKDFQKLKAQFLSAAIEHCQTGTPDYNYLMAEKKAVIESNNEEAKLYYEKVIESVSVDSRLCASASYGLARYYQKANRETDYVNWLCRAAISDVTCPLKENLAMQELAMYLFEHNPDYPERPMQYIYCSMEDAQFYGNRLRIIQISQKLPVIVKEYDKKIKAQRDHLFYFMIALGLLTCGFLFLMLLVHRKNKALDAQRKVVEAQNLELHQQHEQVREKNSLLEELNGRLVNTNKIRENYLRLFMDLCSLYIEKISNYKTLIQRKIKAGQTADLVKVVNSLKLSEEDAASFFRRFDKAFLELYPKFVSEFNTLLRPEEQVSLNIDGSLTTELRIYALVRLGVKESSEIATLLFYSPQTIYNYRTSMKSKAIRRETFDQDVANLCQVM